MPSFVEGQLIDGKYEVLEIISEGGMSEVYKVRHLHLDEPRIVKIMRTDLQSAEETSQRFHHEAKLASRVRHRNIASLHDFSRLDDGSFYMVSEYLDGYTVQSWIREKGRIEAAIAIEIALQVLDGLDVIHKAGVVHRDVSPDNIMIVAAGESEGSSGFTARILDLGIAKSIDDVAGGRTQTGAFVGKARYASPEQAGLLGKGETIDQRSDIYSLGVTLYEMLSGVAPFDSPTPEGYLLKHIHETPAPLTAAMSGVALPAGLAEVIEKAMKKNRDDRYGSAEEFRDALLNLRGQPKTERTLQSAAAEAGVATPAIPAAGKPVSSGRRSSTALIVIAIVALLALGAVWALWRAPSEPAKVEVTESSTTDADVPPLVAEATPMPDVPEEQVQDEYEIVEETESASAGQDDEDESERIESGVAVRTDTEPVRAPQATPTVAPQPTPRPAATRAPQPQATPARPRPTPTARPPQRDRDRVTEAEAVDRVLGFVSSTRYYPVRRECVTTRSLGYANEGYTVEVHGGGCPGDERQRRLGVWRVDIWTGEIFVRNAQGRFVDP